ncbi:MAG: segregation/condensation protein A [bacterium]|nr:segregation/condensation protein A [bacterium]
MNYQVVLDSFEGPLDLLLHLIKKHELDIMDIPVALITDQYLKHIDIMKTLNLDVAGEYILMAATLMHIKSKMLLPPSEEEETEEDGGDPREELVKRLLEYKKYKEASEELLSMDMLDRENFLKGFVEDVEIEDSEEDASHDVTLFDLMEALSDLLKEAKAFNPHEVNREKISVKDKIEIIIQKLSAEGSLTFRSLFDKASSKNDIIATFLALLELMKMKRVRAFQGETFGVIRISSSEKSLGTVH